MLGTSRSAVTAGLIGGRVGNKGGVGITINVDGTTLLFLNAHLAGMSLIMTLALLNPNFYSPRGKGPS